jgi:hypothetical protein
MASHSLVLAAEEPHAGITSRGGRIRATFGPPGRKRRPSRGDRGRLTARSVASRDANECRSACIQRRSSSARRTVRSCTGPQSPSGDGVRAARPLRRLRLQLRSISTEPPSGSSAGRGAVVQRLQASRKEPDGATRRVCVSDGKTGSPSRRSARWRNRLGLGTRRLERRAGPVHQIRGALDQQEEAEAHERER